MSDTKITVFTHSGDWDGKFSEQIARWFLGSGQNVTYVGWNFGDEPLAIPEGRIYVMDLPVDRLFGFDYSKPETVPPNFGETEQQIIHIDHHRSTMASHPDGIPGYRIDGVSAARLVFQWFSAANPYTSELPSKADYGVVVDGKRTPYKVVEPYAVKLVGQYDVFDLEDLNAELFQFGLNSQPLNKWWKFLLSEKGDRSHVEALLASGKYLKFYRDNEYRDVITDQGFDLDFEGLKFLACCSHEADIRSQLFAAGIKPEHDALLGFTYTGKGTWRISFYNAPGKDSDMSVIAKKYGGGGHAGAAGCLVAELPFEI